MLVSKEFVPELSQKDLHDCTLTVFFIQVNFDEEQVFQAYFSTRKQTRVLVRAEIFLQRKCTN